MTLSDTNGKGQTPGAAEAQRPAARRAARDSAALTVGTTVSLLAAYGYVVIGTRYLGADRFAPISVVWTFWALTAAVLTFPVQHWITRTVRADRSEARVRLAMPTLLWSTLAVSALCGLLAWLLRDPLFRRQDLLFPAITAMIPIGSVAMGALRGVLAGRSRFVHAGLSIAGENLVRLAGAVVVALVGGGAVAFACMLVVGFGVGLCWLPAFRFVDGSAEDETVSPLPFLAAVGGGALLSQLVLYGAPIALAILGGAPRHVTAMFAVMALFRVPYAVAVGLATQLTGTLTGYVLDGHHDRMRRVRLLTVIGCATGASAAAVAGASFLSAVARLVFGPEASLPKAVVAALAAASAVAVGTLVYTIVLVARARSGAVAAAWAAALSAAIVVIIAAPGAAVSRVAWAFLAAEIVAFGAMLVLEGSGTAPRPMPEPAQAGAR